MKFIVYYKISSRVEVDAADEESAERMAASQLISSNPVQDSEVEIENVVSEDEYNQAEKRWDELMETLVKINGGRNGKK